MSVLQTKINKSIVLLFTDLPPLSSKVKRISDRSEGGGLSLLPKMAGVRCLLCIRPQVPFVFLSLPYIDVCDCLTCQIDETTCL